MHKVGRITDFGKLVAESVIWANSSQSVAIYEIADEDIPNEDSPAYVSIIWDITEESAEFEVSREYHHNDEDAIVFFLNTAYQVSL